MSDIFLYVEVTFCKSKHFFGMRHWYLALLSGVVALMIAPLGAAAQDTKEPPSPEEMASTAVGEGAAFLHPRFHDPYMFQETFVAYGRSERPVFFGAPDGQGTRHFFLVCSTDHEVHLHILSRLAVMAHATEFLQILDEATDAEQVIEIVRAAEEGFLK